MLGRLSAIPEVIEAARRAHLLNMGGQVQFRLPNGSTRECYWIEVDTYKRVSTELSWQGRVALSANVALRDFQFNFLGVLSAFYSIRC